MAEATTTDTSGIQRTTEGTIVDGQTTQTDQSSATTTQETKTESTEGTSLLNQQEKKTETKVEEKKEGEEGKKEEKKSEGAPEKYEDFKLPDGYELVPEVKTKAEGLFKELGLSQEGAQKLVDFYRETTDAAFRQPFDQYQEMINGWRTEAENHPDLKGKLGPGKEVNVRIAKALDSLGDPELAKDFRSLMDLTGAGNHPAFIRTINAWAKQVTEGSHVAGNGPSEASQSRPGSAPPSAAAAMWPNLKPASGG